MARMTSCSVMDTIHFHVTWGGREERSTASRKIAIMAHWSSHQVLDPMRAIVGSLLTVAGTMTDTGSRTYCGGSWLSSRR